MTITLELPPDALAALQADAREQGRSAEAVAAERLAELYIVQEDEDVAINEALDELEAGKSRPFEEFVQEFSYRFEARYGQA